VQILRPSNPADFRLSRGTTVCVLFCEIAGPLKRSCTKHAVRLMALNGDAGRVFLFL